EMDQETQATQDSQKSFLLVETSPAVSSDNIDKGAEVGEAAADAMVGEASINITPDEGETSAAASIGNISAVSAYTDESSQPIRKISLIEPEWPPSDGLTSSHRRRSKSKRTILIAAFVILGLLVPSGLAISANLGVLHPAVTNPPATITIT